MGSSVLMSWSAVGQAAVSTYFGLGPWDQAVLSVASAAEDMLGRRGEMGAKRRRFAGPPVTAPVGVPNIVPSGAGHYQGDFRKSAVPVQEGLAGAVGFKQEAELYGSLSMNDVQYLTVQSVNLQMISRGVAMAWARMIMWKHFKQTYTSAAEYLFPAYDSTVAYIPQLFNIKIFLRDKGSDGSEVITPSNLFSSTGITATTQLEDLAVALQMALTANATSPAYTINDYRQFHAYQFLFKHTDGSATPAVVNFSYSPRWCLDEQMMYVNVVQVVNLQNTTRGDVNTTGFNAGSREAIDANPIVGRVYHMHGIYPDVESQATSVPDASNFAKRLSKFVTPVHSVGIGVPDINPTGEWRRLPRPQTFANIISCQSGLRLEPGEIKKDVLHFKFYGTLNDLCRGLAYLGTSSGPSTSDHQPVYASNKLGTCKLYAFEKVIPTGTDAVEMNYHIDRYVTCYMPSNWQVLSARAEFFTNKFDLKQGTAPALVARQADAVQHDDVVGVDVDAVLTDA